VTDKKKGTGKKGWQKRVIPSLRSGQRLSDSEESHLFSPRDFSIREFLCFP